MLFFCDVRLCSGVVTNQCLGAIFCLCFQGTAMPFILKNRSIVFLWRLWKFLNFQKSVVVSVTAMFISDLIRFSQTVFGCHWHRDVFQLCWSRSTSGLGFMEVILENTAIIFQCFICNLYFYFMSNIFTFLICHYVRKFVFKFFNYCALCYILQPVSLVYS